MKKILALCLYSLLCAKIFAQGDVWLSPLHVNGNQLNDAEGNKVLLHGVMDTPNPYFNSWRWGWSADDNSIPACIEYFNKLFTAITDTTNGAYCTVFRLHLDPCWTNDPNITKTGDATGEANISQFSEARLRKYLDLLYCKLAENALKHGLYVVIRPPGVCPQSIKVGDKYYYYLLKVWDIVSSHEMIKKYSGQISLELANEPINVYDYYGKDNVFACNSFFQPIVNKIRQNGFDGIIWVPGTGWQSNYRSYATVPVTGKNIGYAVHAYVGWYNNNDDNANAQSFINSFETSVPVVKTNPIIITEVDWSPEVPGAGHTNEHGEYVPKNMGTWATGTTSHWGNAFKAMKDHFGNISMTLTGTGEYVDIDKMLKNGEVVPAFNGNAEACGKACFDWYADYAKEYFPQNSTTAAIKNVDAGKTFAKKGIYDLSGRRYTSVNNLKKGMYIIDGKKVIVR